MLKKTTKCFISIVMAVMMITSMISLTAFAADETTPGGNAGSNTDSTTAWDGTTDETSWYIGHENDTSYTISTAAQLAGLAKLVNAGNTFSGKTITLGADIDLGGQEWTPIGTSGKPFSGTFDGNKKTISNLVINQPVKSDVGLFGYTTNGEIKDFTLNNASVTGYLDVGAIAGTPYTSKYTNINVTGTIKIEGFSYVGGALGKNAYANVTNVDVTGTSESYVKANSISGNIAYRTYVGGLVGFMGEGSHTISDCDVKIDVIGSTCDIGGILGILHYDNTLTNCTYEGSLTLTTPGEPEDTEFGALTGTVMNKNSTTTISNCNATVLKASKGTVDVTDTITAHGDFYYSLNSTENTSGTVSVNATVNNKPVTIENNVAKIGNTGYKSFSSVIEALKGATYPLNEPLELLSDVSIDTWNQIWNVNGLTIKGNNHTITIGQVESNVNGNYLFYGAKNLNVSDVTINFSTNGNGFSMVSGTLDNVKMIGGKSSNYAVYVSASSTGNNKVTVNKCTFDGFKDSAIYSQPAGSQKTTSDIVVNGSTFDNCGMTMCSYAPNTTFTDNTVNGGGEISFAGAAENASRDNTYTITGNTFQDAGKIWFYSADLGNVTFVKNKVLGTTIVSTEQAQSDTNLNVSKNYWGGGAPGNEQLSGSNIVGNDEYYQQSSMNEEDLNTYVPPYTGKYSYEINVAKADNGSVSVDKYATEGDKVTITVAPDKAYKLDELSVTAGGKDVELTDNGDGTYSFTMPSSKVQITATFVEDEDYVEPTPEPSMPFTDVSENDWFYGAVQYVYDNDMMNGVSATSFAPNSNLTRAMMAAVLYNLEDQPTQADSSFTDVVDGSWYADAVNWAAANNIVSGYGDGIFGPNDNITREQMASILYRYAEYKGYDVSAVGDLGQFNDADNVSEWANDVMRWAVGAGLINGMGDGSVAPQGTATRAQVATVLMNFCENIAK